MTGGDGADTIMPLTIEGRCLEGRYFGAPTNGAPTLLLLHEGLGCLALWRDFPSRLVTATGLGVFAWSRAGYGQSSPICLPRPLDYMSREAVEIVPAVIDAVGADPVVLLGHSDGATIAALHAGFVCDPRIIGVILLAPHFFTEPKGLKAIAAAAEVYESGDLRARLARYHRHVDIAFRGWNDAWLDPEFRDWNVADALDHITVPILAIQGREDPYGTLAQIDVIAARAPAVVTSVVLEQCCHAPHLEQTEATLMAIIKFLRDLKGSGRDIAEARV